MISRNTLRQNRLLADALGYGCLLAVPFVGWLPGPGGIPLLLTGLSLLSIHNAWAKKLLNYVKHHSKNLRQLLFPQQRSVMLFWDILGSVCIFASGLIFIYMDGYVRVVLISATLFGGLTILLSNRGRMEKLLPQNKPPLT